MRGPRYACYAISPEGAKQVWVLPDEEQYCVYTGMDTGPMRDIVVRDGLMFEHSEWSGAPRNMDVYRADTGERIYELKEGAHGLGGYVLEDHYMFLGDSAHGDWTGVGFFSLTQPGFLPLGKTGDKPPGLEHVVTAYEVPLENPYVDGVMYIRVQDGCLTAVDLRAQPPATAPVPLPLPEWAGKLSEPLRNLASRYRAERLKAADVWWRCRSINARPIFRPSWIWPRGRITSPVPPPLRHWHPSAPHCPPIPTASAI